MTTVCGAVLELVKVLETIPNVLAVPRDGDVAANVVVGPTRPNTINTKEAASKVKFVF